MNRFWERILPRTARRWITARFRKVSRWPPVGAVRLGSLRRLEPISRDWGFDRGSPIDRFYIEEFLAAHASDIRGDVLEIDVDTYTRQFGGQRVERSHVLSLSGEQAGVTIVGDLESGQNLPSERFDCAILTQTLQLVYDVPAALRTVQRILRPGGVALVTVPGISKIARDPEDRWGSYWAFTDRSARTLFETVFPEGDIGVVVYGNVLTAIAFLHGLAAEELSPEELAHRDPDYQLLVAVRVRKAGGD